MATVQRQASSVFHAPVVPAAAVLAVVMDWVVFATDLATRAQALWWFAALGGFITMAATVGFQLRDANDSHGTALAKGLVLGVAVSAPMPVLGSAVGLVALVWAWVAHRHAHGH